MIFNDVYLILDVNAHDTLDLKTMILINLRPKKIAGSFTNKLEKQQMNGVFVEFYKLDEIQENRDQHTQNYILIRLVIVIEQFF